MTVAVWQRVATALIAVAALAFAGVPAQLPSDAPLESVGTIGQMMASHPQDDIHLILIHGIRTSDRTTWNGFRSRICAHLAGQCLSATPDGPITERLMLWDHPPNATYLGREIWPKDNPAAWAGSQPFVDHYRIKLINNRALTIDEINWWPLVFAFKCQFIVKEDTLLVGPAKDIIGYCADNGQMHFPWFDAATKSRLLALRPVSGGAPAINRALKTELLDWGVSDAVLAEGSMKGMLREMVRCAFSNIGAFNAARFDTLGPGHTDSPPTAYACPKRGALAAMASPDPKGQYVIVSHSLGAFIILDTFAAAATTDKAAATTPADDCEAGAVAIRVLGAPTPDEPPQDPALTGRTRAMCAILALSDHLYFLANQLSLMSLGRAQGLWDFRESADHPQPYADALSLWVAAGAPGHQHRQIIAFSDPGDVLTFEVPCIRGAKVINIFSHNAMDWFGLYESPATAHGGYLTSDPVLSTVFGSPPNRATLRSSRCPAVG
jgi:hypothetical protein